VRPFDWLVVVVYIGWIIIDGLRRSKGTDKVDGYFLANRSLPWWAVGLSVMATQMSAVTIVGTTGQAYLTGLKFVQFYFGLPLAMVILSVTVVPFFTRARVYTAYEYLERRFDVRVRSLAAFLFLVGRAASLGVTLAAPSVVMSAAVGILVYGILQHVSFGQALRLAGATGRLNAIDFRFSLRLKEKSSALSRPVAPARCSAWPKLTFCRMP